MLKVTVEESDGVLVAYLKGDVDHHGAKSARELIDESVSCYSPSTLILDFEKVDFIDSSAVGLIMGRYRLVTQLGAELTVRGLNPRCKKLLQLSGVAAIVKL